jgi:hypothetical protein
MTDKLIKSYWTFCPFCGNKDTIKNEDENYFYCVCNCFDFQTKIKNKVNRILKIKGVTIE